MFQLVLKTYNQLKWRHDTQYNDTQHTDIQHNNTEHKGVRSDTQHR